jgi:excisionase family DNA binding protein
MSQELKCYNISEVAQLLRVSTRTIWRLIAADQLRALRFGRRVCVRHDDLAGFQQLACGRSADAA